MRTPYSFSSSVALAEDLGRGTAATAESTIETAIVCGFSATPRALRILVALLGKDHSHTKDVISCIDDVLKAKGMSDSDALDYLTAVLTSMEHKRGGDNLAEEGNHDMAVAEYRKALVVEEISQGKHHPDTGDIYANIGNSLARQGELKKACVEYGNALAIYAVTLGGDHPDTKETLKNIQNLPTLMLR